MYDPLRFFLIPDPLTFPLISLPPPSLPVMEKGVTKCAQYWPIGESNRDHDSYLFEETGFRVTLLEKEDERYFVVRR